MDFVVLMVFIFLIIISLRYTFKKKIFNARTGGLMMLTNQHNIHQVSYNEGNFQAVCLYCRRALHTFSLNNTLSI